MNECENGSCFCFYLCILEGKKTWSNFTIKKLELDFSTMAKTINTGSFIEIWEGERFLWNVSYVIYKNLYEKGKAQNRKKFAEHFSVTRNQKSYCCSMFMFVFAISSLISRKTLSKSCGVLRRSFCTPIFLQTLILLLSSRRSLD